MKDLGLKIEPRLENGHWMVEAYSDSDWAGDPEGRQPVGSYIIFVNSVPVTWKQVAEPKSMALSSSKAEMFACSEAVRELPFIAEILLFFKAKVITPFKVWLNNVGAIFLAGNKTSSTRTGHINRRMF